MVSTLEGGFIAISKRRYLYMADEELLSLIAVGNTAALNILYDRHSKVAYSLALRRLREREAAEDLVQEAFVKVWRFAGSYRAERGSTRSWILSIVHNHSVDILRRKASRKSTLEQFEILTEKTQPSEAFEQTSRGIERAEMRKALDTLPVEQLQVLELAYFREHTHTQIAQLLELPLGTVKGRIRLGLKRIRDHLYTSANLTRG